MKNPFSIIFPVLDEEGGIVACLDALADYRRRGAEVIVVDGGASCVVGG